MIVVKRDQKIVEILFMFVLVPGDDIFGRDIFVSRTDHDRSAMSIVGTKIIDLPSTHSLVPDKDIGLYIFEKMPKMNRPVGVW